MAFTYTDTLLTDRDKVRFEIGDTITSSGPRPYGSTNSNFSDNEIAAVVTAEGGWAQAAARLCEVLAREWTAEAGRVGMADYSEDYTARADGFRKQAQDLWARYGGRTQVAQPTVTRIDGFSSDVAADET